MKLLIVTQVLDKNHPILGFFHRWVEEFAKNVESVVVIASYVGEYDLPKNVEVHSLGKEKSKPRSDMIYHITSRVGRLFLFLFLIWKLRKQYDAVFVHMIVEFVLVGGIIWKLMRKKIGLWYVHGIVSNRLRSAIPLVDYVFTTSPESCKIESKKIHCLGHGIVIDGKAKKRNGEVPHIITIGRISPSKHLEIILEALEIMQKNNVAFTAEIVGGPATEKDNDYAKRIEEKAKKLGVTYTGPLSHEEALEHLDMADVFVSASETGSVDKAVLEAAAGGIVPVFSNQAFVEALGNINLKVDGHPESFAGLLTVLLNDKDLWEKHAKHVHTAVKEKHSLENLIPGILSFYQNK